MSKSKKLLKIEAKIRLLEQKMMFRILREDPVIDLKVALAKERRVIEARKERAARWRSWRKGVAPA